jgi:hypothetical protein
MITNAIIMVVGSKGWKWSNEGNDGLLITLEASTNQTYSHIAYRTYIFIWIYSFLFIESNGDNGNA